MRKIDPYNYKYEVGIYQRDSKHQLGRCWQLEDTNWYTMTSAITHLADAGCH